MSKAIENLMAAQQYAMSIRPKIGGFPYLAETLRLAGVTKNLWSLPSCQSIYLTKLGVVVNQGTPLITNMMEVPEFNQEFLIRALRIDQAGESTFPQFLKSAWEAGVVSYVADFEGRKVTYFGVLGEFYIEEYPQVAVKDILQFTNL